MQQLPPQAGGGREFCRQGDGGINGAWVGYLGGGVARILLLGCRGSNDVRDFQGPVWALQGLGVGREVRRMDGRSPQNLRC